MAITLPEPKSIVLVMVIAPFLGLWFSAQGASASLREGGVVEISIEMDDPVLDGQGRSKSIEYLASRDSTLYTWATSDDTDLRLYVVDLEGNSLGSGDDSLGGRSALIVCPIRAGQGLRVLVASRAASQSGHVRVGLSEAPRLLPEDRPDLDAAKHLVEQAGEKSRAGKPDEGRALIASAVARLLDLGRRRDRPTGELCSDEIVAALWEAGAVAKDLWDSKDAKDAYEEVLRWRERVYPPRHPDLLRAQILLAYALKLLDDPERARGLEERALEAARATLPDDHPILQQARENLAVTLCMLGDLRRGRALQEKALEVYASALGGDDPNVVRAQMNLSITLKDLGDLPRARELQEKVLAVISRTRPDDDHELQVARQNLANTLSGLGDHLRARELEEKVLQVFSRTLSEEDPDLQGARGNLAGTLYDLGETAEARKLIEKELEVLSRTVSADNRDLQQVKGNLADILRVSGDFARARELDEQVLETLARTLPDEHPDLQVAKDNLADVRCALGELSSAQELLEQVLEVRSRTLPDDHYELQKSRERLAWVLAARGDRDASSEVAKQLAGSLMQALRGWLLSESPREVEDRIVQHRGMISIVLSLAGGAGVFPPDPALEAESLKLVESVRSVGLRSAWIMRDSRSDPDATRLLDETHARGEELVRLVQSGSGRDEIASARGRRETAERALVQYLASRRTGDLLLADPDAESLSAHLAPCTVLVGFWRHALARIDAAQPTVGRSVDGLCAFVIGAHGNLARVELGPLEPIERAVERWRAAVLGASASDLLPERGVAPKAAADPGSELEAGIRLSRLLFDPLLPALGDAEQIVVALDDVLHAMPIDALPDPVAAGGNSSERSGRLLGERWRVETRATLWETLLRHRGSPGTEVVLLGGIDYDAMPEKLDGEGRAAEDNRGSSALASASRGAPASLRGSSSRWTFAPLPATEVEVDAIAALHQLLPEPGGEPRVLRGARASRDALVELAPHSRWLHLATHGWFVRESVSSTLDAKSVDARSGLVPAMTREEQVQGTSPMVLCGLALAGANRAKDALDCIPGMITAEELSALDLSSCELAVLSACDTNVGIRRAGQGVASLQKALQMAGARSVITSLWRVPDEATKDLMIDFYRRLWVERKPKGQALWEAKMKLRSEKDESGRSKYTTRDWAAWVLTGDPN